MKSELAVNTGKTDFPVIASKIREARRYIGCRAEDAARILGVSKHEYSKIELQRSFLNRDKLNKLSKLYYRPVHFFINGDHTPKMKSNSLTIHDTSFSLHDNNELLKFAAFLNAIPKKMLKNGKNSNNQNIFSQSPNKKSGKEIATELTGKLDLGNVCSNKFQIDVFEAIHKVGILLLFRPMKDLLGASAVFGKNIGILLNSELPLELQRLVATCELSRHVINPFRQSDVNQIFTHRLLWNFYGNPVPGHEMSRSLEFVSNFLLPKKVIESLIEKQGWTKAAMTDPSIVYQASLRFGTSYETTIHGLEREKLINKKQRNNLIGFTPKKLKRKLFGNKVSTSSLSNFNVWHLTENDNGLHVQSGLNDFLLFDLFESPSTGYIWNFDELDRNKFSIIDDTRKHSSKTSARSPIKRCVLVKANKQLKMQEVQIQNKQPWEGGESGDFFTFQYQCTPNQKVFWVNSNHQQMSTKCR